MIGPCLSELQPFNGSWFMHLENPFPGGAPIQRIEIYQYDTGEWFWNDELSHHIGPWGTRDQAEADARATYEREWITK
jgi:hypothetical protein